MIVGAINAFNEEGRIGRAVQSLFAAGCEKVLVLDGAWIDDNGDPFGGSDLYSTDSTCDEARQAGAIVEQISCGSDARKQTALIHKAGELGDYVVRIDADEILRSTLPKIAGHSLVWLRNHGGNDIPSIRSTWPRGDDATHPIPLLRVFKSDPTLVCETPGRWSDSRGPVEPYVAGQLRRLLDSLDLVYVHPLCRFYREWRDSEHEMDPADTAAFPILDGVWIDHYRDGARTAEKTAYYEAVA